MWLENLIVYPAPKYPEGNWRTAEFGCEDASFTSMDGTQLHGWYFPYADPRGHLLFLHGNGEHLGFLGEELDRLRTELRLNVLAFDYRGYGRSAGRPCEAGVIADGRSALQWLAERTKTPLGKLILMGRSLGGGVAVQLAAEYGAKGLILWNTFSSLTDAAAYHFPWLPVRWLMRNRYDSLAAITRYAGPLLQTHGTADQILPFDLAQKLFTAATTQDKAFVRVIGGDHNDSPAPEFLDALSEFIDRICLEGTGYGYA